MKLHTRVTHALIADEDHLTLHLSEPNFTRWQRFIHRLKVSYQTVKDWF